MLQKLRDAGLVAPFVWALVGVALLVGLGKWQLNRKAWKEGLILTIAERSKSSPVVAETWDATRCDGKLEFADPNSCEFRQVKLSGHFRHDAERHLFTSGSSATGDKPGYIVMTPFVFSTPAGDRGIYVNRGFVPDSLKNKAERQDSNIDGYVEITGLIRSAEKRHTFTPQPDAERNVYHLRDPREFMDGQFAVAFTPKNGKPAPGLDPSIFYIDQIGDPPASGYPRPSGGKVELSNRHLEYAFTWFGLAGTLIAVFTAFAVARLKETK